jgi:hypothetical protein
MTLVIDTAIPGGQFQKQVTSLVPLDQWKISADLQLMVRSKVRGGGDKSTSSLLTPDPAFKLHSVAMLQAEGRGLELDCSVFTHNKPNPSLTTIPEVDDDTGARMRASIPHTHHTPS